MFEMSLMVIAGRLIWNFAPIMKICVFVLVIMAVLSISFGYTYTKSVVHRQAKHPESNGFWQKKTIWKARWTKYWQERKYYVATWKKVWGPVEINEWIPLPKPPPGWSKKVPTSLS